MISSTYNEVLHWKPNLFMLPSGQQGKRFINELARLFHAFNQQSPLEAIAIKTAMCMPALLLQKPSPKSRTRNHIDSLRRRLDLWENRDFAILLKEGKTIQRRLVERQNHSSGNSSNITRTFTRLMNCGQTKKAIQLLSRTPSKGVLGLDNKIEDKTVREILKEKHPDSKPVSPEALVNHKISHISQDSHLLIFDDISPEDIRQAALHTEGNAGPSGLDAMAWRRLCTAFGECSNNLCSALALFTKRISMTYVDPVTLSAYTAS